MPRFFVIGILSLLFYADLTQATGNTAQPPVIVLDSGHTPNQPGALGIRGQYEVTYNDRLVGMLSKALQSAGFKVVLTRKANQSISLADRAALANKHPARLFLSIHHDSAQPVYLKKIRLKSRQPAFQTIRSIAGFSIFTSQSNPAFAESYRFAEMLGRTLTKLGRSPSLHHAEAIPGEHRQLLAADLGIYRFDDLVVLKKTNLPAVLLEIGVIVDPIDERYIANPDNQKAICAAIVNTIKAYTETS